MIKLLTRIPALILLAVMMTGCVADAPDGTAPSDGECEIVLRLSLRDAVGGVTTRAAYDDDKNPIPPGELMQSLRVVIADGDGAVEHNRVYSGLIGVKEFTSEVFKVKGSDTKKIYLIANEGKLKIQNGKDLIQASDYFATLLPGTLTDPEELTNLAIPFDPNCKEWNLTDRLIPMAAVAEAVVPAKTSEDPQPISVDLHRAATKFTFRITNDSPEPVKLNGVIICNMADKEFLFPNSTTYTTAPDGTPTPSDYATPADMALFDYRETYSNLELPAKGGYIALPSIYFTESERIDGDYSYRASIMVNGVTLEPQPLKWRYPEEAEATHDMKDLPRNTHVVIEVRIKDEHTLHLSACIEPFAERKLFPDFGLERDEYGELIYRDPNGWLVTGNGYFDTPRKYEYVDALGKLIPEKDIFRDEDGNVVKILDFEGYSLSKNGHPLDDMGMEGYRDNGDYGQGLVHVRVRNHEGYIMNTAGHPIDDAGREAFRFVENGIVVVRSYDGYPLNYDGQLVDKDRNPCYRGSDGVVRRVYDDKPIDKDGNIKA